MGLPAALTTALGLEHPIVQAPMAGASTPALAAAVSEAGGLGSLPCALLDADEIRAGVEAIRSRTARPFALNFFCHETPSATPAQLDRWAERLAPYYEELGITVTGAPPPSRASFDEALCDLALEMRPAVVSFHFGLPEPALLRPLQEAGCAIISSATTVTEARWLAGRGCDAVIAQGAEAGGHRAMFLADDAAAQVGTLALVPQVADAVQIPVIAAGGIADARGIAAALALGSSAAQIGTAYLRCPEVALSPLFGRVLADAGDEATVLTNVFTGRPARGIANRLVRELGPISADAPVFPLAAAGVAPLRAAAEQAGSEDFSAFLFGQAAPLARVAPAGELTRMLARETAELLAHLGR